MTVRSGVSSSPVLPPPPPPAVVAPPRSPPPQVVALHVPYYQTLVPSGVMSTRAEIEPFVDVLSGVVTSAGFTTDPAIIPNDYLTQLQGGRIALLNGTGFLILEG